MRKNLIILITGSEGLIGKKLRAELERRGVRVIGLDIRATGEERGDIRDYQTVRKAVENCDGIVHLAAVSRVIDGQKNPELCWETNVAGTENVATAAAESPKKPWLIYGSSREVYGEPESLPATEDSPLKPVNIYGESKLAAEKIVSSAAQKGIVPSIVRFSNVYGSVNDYPDRVVPAFARAAVTGKPLRIEGGENTFDFTHLEDTVAGLIALIQRLAAGDFRPPPIHFTTGKQTSLRQLAQMAVELANSSSPLIDSTPRSFDVSRFAGDPSRARELLGWTPKVSIREGLRRLIEDFREHLDITS